MSPQLVAGVCLVLASGCGAAGISTEVGPAVILHELDASPGCFVPMNDQGSFADQFHDMSLQMTMQQALFFLQPVLDDPAALAWQLSFEGGRIEGQSLARGEDWGELVLVAVTERTSASVDVHYDPGTTVIEFLDNRLVQTDNIIRTEGMSLGCDPISRWSFREAGGTISCWDWTGTALPVPNPADDSREALEMGMSATMQCQQIMMRAMNS